MAQQNFSCKEYWGTLIEYCGMPFDANETCITRLTHSAARGFFFLSAFAENRSETENARATGQLMHDLYAEGLRYRLVLICRESDAPVLNGERSQGVAMALFVPFPEGYDPARFRDAVCSLAYKYEQSQFTFCDPEDLTVAVWQRTEDGEYVPTGSVPFSPENMERDCAGPRGRVLGVRVPDNHISAMCMVQRGHLL